MRILTVRQPWAWAIIHGKKDVENRSRNIAGDYRGPIAVHAGLTYDNAGSWSAGWELLHAAMGAEGSPPWDAPWLGGGAIIGVVDLVEVHESPACWTGDPSQFCSPWAEDDRYHLVLANPRALSEPIPYKGALGLREVPADLLARIEAAL